MKNEIIDLVVKYTQLKVYSVQVSKNNTFVNEAIATLEKQIQDGIDKEKEEKEKAKK